MDWREATSASGERPAVHPDCRHPIKISYIKSFSLLIIVYPHLSPNYFYCRITQTGASYQHRPMTLSFRIEKRVKSDRSSFVLS